MQVYFIDILQNSETKKQEFTQTKEKTLHERNVIKIGAERGN